MNRKCKNERTGNVKKRTGNVKIKNRKCKNERTGNDKNKEQEL